MISKEDFATNTEDRLPVCILLDTSSSMEALIKYDDWKPTGETKEIDGLRAEVGTAVNPYTRCDAVTKGVNSFFDEVRSDPHARRACEIAVLTFDDDVKVQQDFAPIASIGEFKKPQLGEKTSLGKAVKKAIEMLNERKAYYKDNRVRYSQPWLVIFTDYISTDSEEVDKEAQRLTLQLVKDKKLVVYASALDENVDKEMLKAFTGQEPIVITDEKSIREMFSFLGMSVSYALAGKGAMSYPANDSTTPRRVSSQVQEDDVHGDL